MTKARLEEDLGLEEARQRIGRRKLGSVQERQPFFGTKLQRREPGLAPGPRRPGPMRPATRISLAPIIAAAMCARGARSPDAPTEPWTGTTGIKSRSSRASSMATVSGRTPEAPCARLASLSAIISRTIGAGAASPTPAACDSTMLRCKDFEVARCDLDARQLAEAGVDAVNGLALGDDPLDGLVRRAEWRPGRRDRASSAAPR